MAAIYVTYGSPRLLVDPGDTVKWDPPVKICRQCSASDVGWYRSQLFVRDGAFS